MEATMSEECLTCGGKADYCIPRTDESLGVCQSCWDQRRNNTLPSTLAGHDVLTPDMLGVVRERFYDATEPLDTVASFPGSVVFPDEIRRSPVRASTIEQAMQLATLSIGDGEVYASRRQHGLQKALDTGDETTHLSLLAYNVPGGLDVHATTLCAGATFEDLVVALEDVVDEWIDMQPTADGGAI